MDELTKPDLSKMIFVYRPNEGFYRKSYWMTGTYIRGASPIITVLLIGPYPTLDEAWDSF